MKTSVILLAGGVGERMGRPIPKQFIHLNHKPISHYSLDVLISLKEVQETIVVCAQEYRQFFAGYRVKFADPGPQRQDSVYNGLQKVSKNAQWVTIHDSARPFITEKMVQTLFSEGHEIGAASLAMPIKNTLKEIGDMKFVNQTIDRSRIWEIQTPQLLKKEILKDGFSYLHRKGLSVTDDVSLAELIGRPVKLVLGSYQNIKITTPEDLDFAEWLIQKNTACASPMMEPASAAGKSSPIASLSKGS